MAEVPDFIKQYLHQQLRDMRRGMRIKFIIPQNDLVQMILDHIELEPTED